MITFLERTGVEDANNFARFCIWNVGYELKRVGEGRYDERVVEGEGSLDEVEANATRIYDDETRDVCSAFVDDGLGKGSSQQGEDIAVGTEWLAVLAVRFGSTSVQCRQIKCFSSLRDLMGDVFAYRGIECIVLRTFSMIGKGESVPIQIAARIHKTRRVR